MSIISLSNTCANHIQSFASTHLLSYLHFRLKSHRPLQANIELKMDSIVINKIYINL